MRALNTNELQVASGGALPCMGSCMVAALIGTTLTGYISYELTEKYVYGLITAIIAGCIYLAERSHEEKIAVHFC